MRRGLVRGTLVVSLALTSVAYAGLEKRVTVTDEGESIAVRTFAGSVGDAIARAGILLGPDDRVEPPPSAPLADGAMVEIFRAKPVTILLNGEPKRVVVTALTVHEVLEEMELRARLVDFVFPSRSAPVREGMMITFREAVTVTVVRDAEREEVITNAPTVAQIVSDLEIEVGELDRVEPDLSVAPTEGLEVRVIRVSERIETEQIAIPYRTLTREDPTLEHGRQRVVQEGREGVREIRYRAMYEDGTRVSRSRIDERVVREPRERIVAVGRGSPSCRCDRGEQAGKASWYRIEGLTAAHRTLPFGTVVRVTNTANGRTVNVVIRDRGPFIDGRIIDLSDSAFQRLAPLGRGVINVVIEW